MGAEVGDLVGVRGGDAQGAGLVGDGEAVAGLGLEGGGALAEGLGEVAGEVGLQLLVAGGAGGGDRGADAARACTAGPDMRALNSCVRSPAKTRCEWESTKPGTTARPPASTRLSVAGALLDSPVHAMRSPSMTTAASWISPRGTVTEGGVVGDQRGDVGDDGAAQSGRPHADGWTVGRFCRLAALRRRPRALSAHPVRVCAPRPARRAGRPRPCGARPPPTPRIPPSPRRAAAPARPS